MIAWVRRAASRPSVRRFVTFFGASAVGLLIDLVGFQALLALSVPPWVSNATSSFISITAVYLLATRHTFGAQPRVITYVVFVAWYSASIVVFSTIIQAATSASDVHPFVWKLATVPVSFALNYLFSTLLFQRLRDSGIDDGSAVAPASDDN